jgi:hypothetical protein
LDAGAFDADGVTALLDLGSGECAVGGQVDEAFFAGFQLGQLLDERCTQFLSELLVVGHRFGEPGLDLSGEVIGEVEAVAVVGGNGVLDLADR